MWYSEESPAAFVMRKNSPVVVGLTLILLSPSKLRAFPTYTVDESMSGRRQLLIGLAKQYIFGLWKHLMMFCKDRVKDHGPMVV